MQYLIATIHTLGVTSTARLHGKIDELRTARERGSVTLEQVVIALGLFLIAGLVVAGITAAINSRLANIR
jgi:cation transporter-like permease